MNPALKTPLAGLGLMLAGVIALPTSAALAFDSSRLESQSGELIARKGGGGGGGGARKGGGGGGGGARKAGGHSGFSNAGGGLNRGSAKPTGGWSNKAKVGGGAAGGPSLNRPAAATRPAAGNRAATGARPGGTIGSGDRMASRDKPASRDLSRDGNRSLSRDVNRDFNRDVNRNISRDVNRNWNRNVDINRVNLYPGWARPGWGVARPWNYGWYGGWSTPAWGWWGARAAAWGVTTLATAAIINDAVDDAVDDHNSYIVVPNTNYQLLYGTVQPSSSDSVSFVVQANGNDYQLSANCNQGTINGQEPSNAEEAELLNAACQVAYGSV
jgi:hypothetical protein